MLAKIIVALGIYKINFMTQQLIYDLPKVKLRFKTAPSQPDEGNHPERIAPFKEYNAGPSIFLERLKMGK